MSIALVIEADPRERATLVRALSQSRGMTVLSVVNLEEAAQVWAVQPFEFVIFGVPSAADFSLQEAVDHIRNANPEVGILLVQSGGDTSLALDGRKDVYFAERPVQQSKLVLLLRHHIGTSQAMVPHFGLADVLQMLALGSHTALIVCSKAGQDVGAVEVVQGDVWSVADSDGEGISALSRLLAPEVSARSKLLKPLPVERKITMDWQELLFEAARVRDESSTTPPASGPKFEELMRDAGSALLSRDYAKASMLYLQAAEQRPTDPVVLANLERLRKLGHIAGK